MYRLNRDSDIMTSKTSNTKHARVNHNQRNNINNPNNNNNNGDNNNPNQYCYRLVEKAHDIDLILNEPEIDLWMLRELALTEGGLVNGMFFVISFVF